MEKVFELGFDLAISTQSHLISGVRKGSRAQLAGLQGGQAFTCGVSIYNDLRKPAKVQLLVDGKKQTIEFFPVQNTTIHIPQIITKVQ